MIPEYLFHYTTIESLALILKNRNIKFNPLSVLDDKQEEKIKDKQRFSHYIFVSSWTEDDNESIPMWNLYSNLTSGVRIKTIPFPFQEYPLSEELNKENPYNIVFKSEMRSVVPAEEFISKPYIIFPFTQKDILYKVEYTDEIEKLEPTIYRERFIEFGKLGKYKKTHWAFQKEWRYIIRFSPMGFKEIYANMKNMERSLNSRYSAHSSCLPFNYYFLNLSDYGYLNMEITLSPKISDGNRDIVNLLKEKYNPNMKIKESELYNLIR